MATDERLTAQETFIDDTASKGLCDIIRTSSEFSQKSPICKFVHDHSEKDSYPSSHYLSTENVRSVSKPSRDYSATLLSSGPDVEEAFQGISQELEEWFNLLARSHQQARDCDRHWLVRLLTCGCLIG